MKKVFSICISLGLALVLVNGILFFYERPVAWIDTPNGPSRAVRKPKVMLVHGTEGYSMSNIDTYGFTNMDYPLNDEYVLMMGASHTQGKEMSVEKRYSSIVNTYLVEEMNTLAAFNIACDGHFLPSIIKHFNSAITVYPNAKAVIIEIGSTDYSLDELKNAILQPDEIDTRSAVELFEEQSTTSKIKNLIKENIPILSMIKSQIETARETQVVEGEYCVNEEEYRSVITDCLTLIRSQFDGSIVFIYHPNTEIQIDGSIKLLKSRTLDIFEEVCGDIGIDFIDTGDAFLEYYNEYHELPYGFDNTAPGKGHLNEVGHQILADSIIDYLEGVCCK